MKRKRPVGFGTASQSKKKNSREGVYIVQSDYLLDAIAVEIAGSDGDDSLIILGQEEVTPSMLRGICQTLILTKSYAALWEVPMPSGNRTFALHVSKCKSRLQSLAEEAFGSVIAGVDIFSPLNSVNPRVLPEHGTCDCPMSIIDGNGVPMTPTVTHEPG